MFPVKDVLRYDIVNNIKLQISGGFSRIYRIDNLTEQKPSCDIIFIVKQWNHNNTIHCHEIFAQ